MVSCTLSYVPASFNLRISKVTRCLIQVIMGAFLLSPQCFFGRSLIANLYLTGMRIFNLISWLIFPVSLMFVGVFILWALSIIMINRLFLNLRNLHISEQETYYHSAKVGHPRTHTPAAFPHRPQSTNIFRGGTMIGDEELPTTSPTRSIGIVGVQFTRTEEWRSSPLDDQWPINVAPMPDEAHCLTHFLPYDAPFQQTQILVPTTATTPLMCAAEGSVSPQASLNLGTAASSRSKAIDRALECSYDDKTVSTRTKRVLTKRATETSGGHLPLSRLGSQDP